MMKTVWFQRVLELPARSRGFHLITSEIVDAIPELSQVRMGQLHLFLQHTSASLAISENADPDVPLDLESSFNSLAPEDFPYVHTMEGPDDMPAHVKSALLGVSHLIPITNGRLALGVWQGIFLCEHRDRASRRRIILTVQGAA